MSPPHSAQARATASDCRWALIAPLLRPVVPEVNRMSLTSPGCTAAARASAALAGTAAARSSKSAQPMARSAHVPAESAASGTAADHAPRCPGSAGDGHRSAG